MTKSHPTFHEKKWVNRFACLETSVFKEFFVAKFMGAIWWGTRGTCPPFFRRGGHNMPCPPTFFSFGFVFGEVSKIKVMLVTL